MVSRSYGRDTNKGLKEEAVRMAAELVPFLRINVNVMHKVPGPFAARGARRRPGHRGRDGRA